MNARTTSSRFTRSTRRVRTAALLAVLPIAAAPLLVTTPAHAEGGVAVSADVPPGNHRDWHRGSVSVGLDVSAEDGVDSGSWKVTNNGRTVAEGHLDEGHTDVQIDTEGWNTLTYIVVGPTGRQAAGGRDIKIDSTAPGIEVTAPAEGATVNQGDSLTARYSCSDATSQLESCVLENGARPEGVLDTSTPGKHTVDVRAFDRAGNEARRTITYRVIGRDTTAPTVDGSVISGERGANGWFVSSTVLFRSTAVDPDVPDAVTSGLHHLDTNLDGDQRQATSGTVYTHIDTQGLHTLKWAAADNADNASGVQSVDLNIDSVAPSTGITYPSDGAVLSPDSPAEASTGCFDAASGLESCRTVVDGDSVGTTLDLTPGVHTLQVFARDRAGHISGVTYTYSVPGAEAPTKTRLVDVEVSRRGAGSATVVVRSADSHAEGSVSIFDGRRRIATADLIFSTDGPSNVTVDLPKFRRGVHRLRAVYGGSVYSAPSKSRWVTVRVR